ncbi:hypothetical protein Btru_029853 [Bulinus truncatus]|nr:hypothetical protein Btru_029853 [Bulinus truncatus]
MALNNIRALEIAKYAADAAVPYCGMILSDFGASVIKIDMPHSPNTDYMSRGKRSAVVDIYMKEGAAVVKKMCNKADVLLESLQPGTMEKLELGPEVLTKENPKLIYARLTGYGQTGQLAQKSGTDINYTAMSVE